MSVATVKMSSKGQIVIPQEILNELHASGGTIFAVIGSKDSVVLKKALSKEDLIKGLGSFAKDSRKRLKAKGVKVSDIPAIVTKCRKGIDKSCFRYKHPSPVYPMEQ